MALIRASGAVLTLALVGVAILLLDCVLNDARLWHHNLASTLVLLFCAMVHRRLDDEARRRRSGCARPARVRFSRPRADVPLVACTLRRRGRVSAAARSSTAT